MQQVSFKKTGKVQFKLHVEHGLQWTGKNQN
jgi:hypothetical protein